MLATQHGSSQQQNNTQPIGPQTATAVKSEPAVEPKSEIKNETPKQEGIQTGGGSSTGATNATVDHLSPVALNANSSKKCKFGFPASQASNYSVADCRALVKTLVCGVKTITWGCTSCKQEAGGAGASGAAGNAGANTPTTPAGMQQKQFQPKETLVYIRLVKWAMAVSYTHLTQPTILRV